MIQRVVPGIPNPASFLQLDKDGKLKLNPELARQATAKNGYVDTVMNQTNRNPGLESLQKTTSGYTIMTRNNQFSFLRFDSQGNLIQAEDAHLATAKMLSHAEINNINTDLGEAAGNRVPLANNPVSRLLSNWP